jgi:hypothetical protein
VDIRVKTFACEAVRQLDFLTERYGFAGPDIEHGTSPGTAVSVRYRRGDVTIEASLVLWYMGEEVSGYHAGRRRPRRLGPAHRTGPQLSVT